MTHFLYFLPQAEALLRGTLNDRKSVDRWTAAQCLAYYGECDSEVVGELIAQLMTTQDPIRTDQAGFLLSRLSENSVRLLLVLYWQKFVPIIVSQDLELKEK